MILPQAITFRYRRNTLLAEFNYGISNTVGIIGLFLVDHDSFILLPRGDAVQPLNEKSSRVSQNRNEHAFRASKRNFNHLRASHLFPAMIATCLHRTTTKRIDTRTSIIV